jgi:predicted HicB family RNase H-like nuclease
VKAQPRTATAIRFPVELHEQLTEAAEVRGLTVNRLVVEAVQDFLPRLIPVDEWKLTR